MITISYTLTPTIQDNLVVIDQLRRSILTTPLSPRSELRLRWQATREQIYGSLRLAGLSISKAGLTHILLHPVKRPAEVESQAMTYRETLETIRADWTANPKLITPATVESLCEIAMPSRTRELLRTIRENETDLKHLFNYSTSQKDHPVLLAAVVYGQLMQSEVGTTTHGLIPRLISWLTLTKYGYDCRGMLALESQWLDTPENHEKALGSIATYAHLTVWLEHFTKAVRYAYEGLYKSIQQVTEGIATDIAASTWSLNSREERILRLLESPTSKITNREAQHMFHVSQVTASRDLAHLASLGLLYAHGKGRSVYYTKI